MNNQEAIASLKNIVEYWTYKPTEVEAAKLAITALEAQQADAWTITFHDIPKNNGKYKVVLFDDWTKQLFETDLEYDNGFNAGKGNYVIAWKPLQEPYKEEAYAERK